MRIVIDCRCVFTGCGGIGRYATSLVEALAAVDDYDDIVLLRCEGKACEPIVHCPNVTERPVPAAMLDWEFEQLQLPHVLEELGAQLYHNPTFCLPVVRTCRQVATVHDVVFRDRPELVRPGLRDYLDRASQTAVTAADRVITVSEYSRARLCEVYGVDPDRVDVTMEAAAASFGPRYGGAMEQRLRTTYGISGPYILYVGSLEPKKNIDRLLQAFVAVKRRANLPHRLVLAGGGGGMDYDAAEAATCSARQPTRSSPATCRRNCCRMPTTPPMFSSTRVCMKASGCRRWRRWRAVRRWLYQTRPRCRRWLEMPP